MSFVIPKATGHSSINLNCIKHKNIVHSLKTYEGYTTIIYIYYYHILRGRVKEKFFQLKLGVNSGNKEVLKKWSYKVLTGDSIKT